MRTEVVELTKDEARRIAVRAQLLDAERPGDLVEVAEQVGSIKIDPTATIMTAEHATAWARIGWGYEPGHLKKSVEEDHTLFEHNGHFHAASLLPAMYARMRAYRHRTAAAEWLAANAAFQRDVQERLERDGPLLAGDIVDTSAVAHDDVAGWYGSNQVPRMLELLARTGDVAIVGRVGRQRVWDVGARAYAGVAPRDEEAATAELQERRLAAAGIARENSPWTRVGKSGVAARVEGSTWRWRGE